LVLESRHALVPPKKNSKPMHKPPSARSNKTAEDARESPPLARRDHVSKTQQSAPEPTYSLATWTGAAYADHRAIYIAIGGALVLLGSIAVALWLTR
jgi:hypothetical protein